MLYGLSFYVRSMIHLKLVFVYRVRWRLWFCPSYKPSCSSTIFGNDFPFSLILSQCLEWSFQVCQITLLFFQTFQWFPMSKAKIGPIKVPHDLKTSPIKVVHFHPDLIYCYFPHCSFTHSFLNLLTSLLFFDHAQHTLTLGFLVGKLFPLHCSFLYLL